MTVFWNTQSSCYGGRRPPCGKCVDVEDELRTRGGVREEGKENAEINQV